MNIRKKLKDKYYLNWCPKNNIFNKEEKQITNTLLKNMYVEYIEKLKEFIEEINTLKKQITKIDFTPNYRQLGGYNRCITNYPDKGWSEKYNHFIQAYKELMVDYLYYEGIEYDELSINELDTQIEMAKFLIKQAEINISELTESK